MSKNSVKGDFFERLDFFLSFHFNEEERADILNDYKEWFNNEILQGKSEEEICLAFGTPKKIVKNIVSEAGSSSSRTSVFLQNNVTQGFAFIIIQWIMSLSFYRVYSTNSVNFLYFALIINFLCFIMGVGIIKKSCYVKSHRFKWNLLISNMALLIILFEALFLPNMNYLYIGKLCDFTEIVLLLSLLGAGLYAVAKKMLYSRQFVIFTLLHMSGAITLLFFLRNQSHALYRSASEFRILIYGSIAIYIETILCCFVYYRRRMHERK